MYAPLRQRKNIFSRCMHLCDNGKIYFLDVCTPAATEKYIFLMYAPLRQRKKYIFLMYAPPRQRKKYIFLMYAPLRQRKKYIFSKDASLQQWKEIFSMLQTEGRMHLFLIEIVHSGSRNHRLSPCFLLILQPR